MSNLPDPNKGLQQMTTDELKALLDFRREELKYEWCATLIFQDIDNIVRELKRREAEGR